MNFNTKKFIDGLHDYLQKAFTPVWTKQRELEARVAALERGEAKALTLVDVYRGGWQPNHDYERGALVTFSGSLYLALRETDGRPANSADWRMIVRGGSGS